MNDKSKQDDWQDIAKKHTTYTRLKLMRKYDLLDLLTIFLYNAVVFAAGVGLGWFVWGR